MQYRGGPITVAEYMKEVLTNPLGGFYSSDHPVFGKRGHFVTAPDISELFGDVRSPPSQRSLPRPAPSLCCNLAPSQPQLAACLPSVGTNPRHPYLQVRKCILCADAERVGAAHVHRHGAAEPRKLHRAGPRPRHAHPPNPRRPGAHAGRRRSPARHGHSLRGGVCAPAARPA